MRPCVVEAVRPSACQVLHRRARQIRRQGDQGRRFDAIGPGGCFGEMSLLYSAKRL